MADNKAYIFGYGSLMLTVSRTATAPDPEGLQFIPTKLHGYHRTWNLWSKTSKMRVLVAEEQAGGSLNGVIYAVNESDLPKFDQRENPEAYQRQGESTGCTLVQINVN